MARKKLSKYELEVIEATKLLHAVIFDDNYKLGYYEKLHSLACSRTFNRRDFDAVVYGIAFSHRIDITRIDATGVYELVMEPEMG